MHPRKTDTTMEKMTMNEDTSPTKNGDFSTLPCWFGGGLFCVNIIPKFQPTKTLGRYVVFAYVCFWWVRYFTGLKQKTGENIQSVNAYQMRRIIRWETFFYLKNSLWRIYFVTPMTPQDFCVVAFRSTNLDLSISMCSVSKLSRSCRRKPTHRDL